MLIKQYIDEATKSNFPFDVDQIDIQLFIWKDENGIPLHAYSPTDRPVFLTKKTNVTLSIDLIEDTASANKFSFHGYIKRAKNATLNSVTGKKRSSSTYAVPSNTHMFDDDTVSIKFNISLPQGSHDGCYLDIILAEKGGGLISCDPQVENSSGGTLTLRFDESCFQVT